jgi:hypothetical protein
MVSEELNTSIFRFQGYIPLTITDLFIAVKT